MRKCQMNVDMSREVYEYFKDHIKLKECYNNVFNVFTLCPKTFRDGKWKVAYGYVEAMPLLYCRHCFILDEHGKVIDPTAFAHDEPQTQREYFVMTVFDDTDEYLNAIEENDLMPALDKYLREQDKKALQWAKDKEIVFVG